MYATCITCHAPLGANEMLERFPVGRKLAIDAAKGRLWAVCRVCKQWNLSPLDERWEAIEEGERLFRDSRLRASTENIGLARLKDGTELIRVGDPQRPEFAAWRYGERFTRRWAIRGPAAAVGGGLVMVTKAVGVTGMIQFATLPLIGIVLLTAGAELVKMTRKVADLELPAGGLARLTQEHVNTMRILRDPDEAGGWHLRVRHAPLAGGRAFFNPRDPELVVRGAAALRVATKLLPRLNRVGGRAKTVAEAVSVLERAGSAEKVFKLASRLDPASARTARGEAPGDLPVHDGEDGFASSFARADAPMRLAVEMAAHEEQERAVMAGELEDLEAQWREAEEIAAIADGLTLPPAVLAQLERLRLR